MCEEKRKIFLQTSPFPAVKTRKMKGLLGINYSQHLADEDGLESDQEGDDKSHIFLLSEKAFCAHYRWPRSGTKHSFLSHYDLLQCTFWEIKHSCCWFMFSEEVYQSVQKLKPKCAKCEFYFIPTCTQMYQVFPESHSSCPFHRALSGELFHTKITNLYWKSNTQDEEKSWMIHIIQVVLGSPSEHP